MDTTSLRRQKNGDNFPPVWWRDHLFFGSTQLWSTWQLNFRSSINTWQLIKIRGSSLCHRTQRDEPRQNGPYAICGSWSLRSACACAHRRISGASLPNVMPHQWFRDVLQRIYYVLIRLCCCVDRFGTILIGDDGVTLLSWRVTASAFN